MTRSEYRADARSIWSAAKPAADCLSSVAGASMDLGHYDAELLEELAALSGGHVEHVLMLGDATLGTTVLSHMVAVQHGVRVAASGARPGRPGDEALTIHVCGAGEGRSGTREEALAAIRQSIRPSKSCSCPGEGDGCETCAEEPPVCRRCKEDLPAEADGYCASCAFDVDQMASGRQAGS